MCAISATRTENREDRRVANPALTDGACAPRTGHKLCYDTKIRVCDGDMPDMDTSHPHTPTHTSPHTVDALHDSYVVAINSAIESGHEHRVPALVAAYARESGQDVAQSKRAPLLTFLRRRAH